MVSNSHQEISSFRWGRNDFNHYKENPFSRGKTRQALPLRCYPFLHFQVPLGHKASWLTAMETNTSAKFCFSLNSCNSCLIICLPYSQCSRVLAIAPHLGHGWSGSCGLRKLSRNLREQWLSVHLSTTVTRQSTYDNLMCRWGRASVKNSKWSSEPALPGTFHTAFYLKPPLADGIAFFHLKNKIVNSEARRW